MLKAVIFDLDGTLLPMNEDEFTKGYFSLLCKKLAKYGFDKDELVETIWRGTKAMIANDGARTNEEAFWSVFCEKYGQKGIDAKALFDEFYVTEFKQAKVFCKENAFAKPIVTKIRKSGVKTILASNPVFPRNGMLTRMSFVNLCENDFDYITSYETSRYAKPNPAFLLEVLEKNGLKNDEVIYFGNSEKEDLIPATKAGVKCFMVGDNVSLINRDSAPEILKYPDISGVVNKYIGG